GTIAIVARELQQFTDEVVGFAARLGPARSPTPYGQHLPLQLGELGLLALSPSALVICVGRHRASPYVRYALRKWRASRRNPRRGRFLFDSHRRQRLIAGHMSRPPRRSERPSRLRPSEARHGRQRASARGKMQKISAGKFHGIPL